MRVSLRHRGSRRRRVFAGLRLWARRTRVRLTLTYSLLLSLLGAASAAGVWLTLRAQEYSAVDRDLRSEVTQLISGVSDNNGRITFEGGDPVPPPTSGDAAVRAVLVVAGVAVARVGQAPPERAARLAASSLGSGPGPVLVTSDDAGQHLRLAAAAVPDRPGAVLVVARDLGPIDDRLKRDAWLLTIGVATIVGGASLLGYRLAAAALRPVGEIAATARAIGERALDRRVDLRLPDDELGELAVTFNRMLDRLQEAFRTLRHFTADAAHELRAPLTLMRTELELALAQAPSEAAGQSRLRSLLGEVERLSTVVDRLLLLSRADSGALRVEGEHVDLVDLVEETAWRWQNFAAGRGVTLVTRTPDVGWLVGDRHLLHSVLDNLLDNAVRHSPDGGIVAVEVERRGQWWWLGITDQGPGIPPEFHARLFQRFARPDRSRTRGTGGAGLGLAVVKAVVEAHRGKVGVSHAEPGTRFEVWLPAPDPPASAEGGASWGGLTEPQGTCRRR